MSRDWLLTLLVVSPEVFAVAIAVPVLALRLARHALAHRTAEAHATSTSARAGA